MSPALAFARVVLALSALPFVAVGAGFLPPGTTELVPGGIEAETRQCLENIRAILERNGSGLDRVVKCTAFLADIAEWPRMNAVSVTFFPKALPARSAFAVGGGLAFGARVELECIAAAGPG